MAHQPLIVQLDEEDEQAIPLIQRAAIFLLSTNAQCDRTISKETHCVFAVAEAVHHIALPVPAHELGSPPLARHGLCRMCNQPVHHLLDQEQRGQSRQQTQQSRFIRLPAVSKFPCGCP
jgi:hypothetical protein